MTIIAIVILTAFILGAAWLLGQLTVVASRLAVVFAIWTGGAIVKWQIDRTGTGGEPLMMALTVLAILFIVGAARFVVQPLTWGIADYYAGLDAQMEAETAEVQP